MAVLLFLVLFLAMTGHSSAVYCVCKDGVGDSALQKALDYACGAGADCSAIMQNGACYNPNTVKNHCDYAVNSYFQRKGQATGSCDFAGAATTTSSVTSQSSTCVYQSSPSTTTPSTTPPSSTTTPPSGTTTPPSSTTTPPSSTTTPSTTPPSTTTPSTTPPGSTVTPSTTPSSTTTPSTTPSSVFGTGLGPTGITNTDSSFAPTSLVFSSARLFWYISGLVLLLWG